MANLWSFSDTEAYIMDFAGPITLNDAVQAFERVWFGTENKNKPAHYEKNSEIFIYAYDTTKKKLGYCYCTLPKSLKEFIKSFGEEYTWKFSDPPITKSVLVSVRVKTPSSGEEKWMNLARNNPEESHDISHEYAYCVKDGPLFQYPYVPLKQAAMHGIPFLQYKIPFTKYVDTITNPEAHVGVNLCGNYYPQGNYLKIRGTELEEDLTLNTVVCHTYSKTAGAIWRECFRSKSFNCIEVECDNENNLRFLSFDEYDKPMKESQFLFFKAPYDQPGVIVKTIKYHDRAKFMKPVSFGPSFDAYGEWFVRAVPELAETIRLNNPYVRKRMPDASVEGLTSVKRQKTLETVMLY